MNPRWQSALDETRLLWTEHRDKMAGLQAAAGKGDRVAEAKLIMLPVMQSRHRALADAGRLLAWAVANADQITAIAGDPLE